MADTGTEHPPVRFLSVLCVVYGVLLLYASLMPFDFTGDPGMHRAHMARVWTFKPFGLQRCSRSDLISNVAVYAPLGLLIAARLALAGGRCRWTAFVAPTLVGGSISASVEYAQSYSLSRVASGTDFLMNLTGTAAGAAAGALFGARAWRWFVAAVRSKYTERPLVLVAALLLMILAADATFPYRPTIDVSSVKHNLRQSSLDPKEGFSRHPWHQWVVDRAGVYAVLAWLLAAAGRGPLRRRWSLAAAGALCFVVLTEVCKLFIEGRSANTANVLSSAVGVLAALAAAAVSRQGMSAWLRRLLPALLLGAYVVYFEWTPFTFTWDVSRLTEKMPTGAEWLPLYHYAMGARAEDVLNFLRTLIVVGALTYATALPWRGFGEGGTARRVLNAVLLTGGVGLVLEFGQFFLERVPSVTDVFCFAAAGALGAWVYLCYPPPEPHAVPPH